MTTDSTPTVKVDLDELEASAEEFADKCGHFASKQSHGWIGCVAPILAMLREREAPLIAEVRASRAGAQTQAAVNPFPGVRCGEGVTRDGCGETKNFIPAWKGDSNVAYRCLDCGIAFCKWCLKGHFEKSICARSEP